MRRTAVVSVAIAVVIATVALMSVPAFAQGVSCSNVTSSDSPLNGLQFGNGNAVGNGSINSCGHDDSGIATPSPSYILDLLAALFSIR
jgi:Tfp pilus assembly protein FimT